ncbi:MAG TPA: efflux RND transporter permease subunit [Myxococcales bacterium]|nr:efflux RND transporter permease subunit [Myxococcales bacterium]HIL01576.1 efflux RND transporter permease subunit [Myxococcales bacterium]
MTLSDLSIERPVLTWMMILALIVFGVLGYNRLGVDQFPNMEFPVLSVTSLLDDATPEGIEEDVTDVLEEGFNTIAGVRKISSTSFRGASMIQVEFELGTDLDVAAQEVRDKVAQARFELPAEVEPPMVNTFNPNDQPVLWIPLKTNKSSVATMEVVKRQINPRFETIQGVAGVAIFGGLERNIRIWLDGDALRARRLSAIDVFQAFKREHVELPAGKVEGNRVEYAVTTDAEFESIQSLERMVVSQVDGAPVLLRDVARVEDGAEDEKVVARYNGALTVGLGIRKQSGGNTVGIVDEVLRRIDEIQLVLPEGIEFENPDGFIDFSRGVREAVAETQFTLVVGALLAVLTVFVFLRRTRPTLIVALAIPISLVATFGLVWLFGFTLNTMTLLGMTLAVGVVIDDAIVVLENIERHREQGETARMAAKKGTREIAFAATAATISVAAVFIPVVFVEGLVGSFLGEFGLVVAGSVMISLFVALTVTPMLAARMPAPKPRKPKSIYARLERGFESLESGYRRTLDLSLRHRALTAIATLASLGLAALFGMELKREFFPPSDEGIFFSNSEAPPGTSLAASLEYMQQDEAWFLAQPEIVGIFSAAGTGGGYDPTSRSNRSMIFGTLASSENRSRSVMEVIAAAREDLGSIPGRQIRIFNPGESMMSRGGGFDVDLRGNLPLEELDRISDEFIAALALIPGFVDLDKSLKLGLPELTVKPDREKAAAMGVDARAIAQTIQMMVGGMDVGTFKEEGRRYDIRMRVEGEDRADPEAIGELYVRNRNGEPVALRNLVSVELGAAPSEITRIDRQRSVNISANLQGIKLADAVQHAQRVAEEVLPPGIGLAMSGEAEAMQEGNEQFGLAMGLGILVIYMILAAQFESLVHPLTVMLALPLSLVGALGGLLLFGHSLNIFSMIGIILLLGLVTKNSILLVDYANQLRRGGMDKVEAMRTAAPIRMRPVLMTAISMIFGVLPAALGIGPGSETRAPMAIATAMGMFSSTLLTLLVIPVFYLLLDDAAEWFKKIFRQIFGGSRAAEAKAVEN